MSCQPAQSVAAPAEPLCFGRYSLDLSGGRLLHDGRELLLRPKTFAVLCHLVENAGRLVSKDELFAAVWPNVAVTDDVLVQSISELRQALGPDGSDSIRTVPRRGYRFDAPVRVLAAASGEIAARATGAGPAQDNTTTTSPSPSSGPAQRRPAPRNALTRPFVAAALVVVLVMAIGVWLQDRLLPARVESATPIHGQGSVARPAIAVLPFTSREDAGADYFADGVTQDIITALGRFPTLTVMSWSAVQAYRGRSAPPREIARSLAVGYQVEGRLRQSGGRLRVDAQLVDTDGRVLWSNRFDEALADVFVLQDKITAELAGALAVKLARFEQQRALAKPTENLEAYDLVLRARPALERPSRGGSSEARELLRRALELDPNYAAAYAALAESHYTDVSMGWAQSPAATLARAENFANKALSLDASQLRARIVLGRIHLLHRRYEPAQAELERAVAINPNDAQGLAGLGNILVWLGQADAAIGALELAQRIDPELSAIDRFSLSLAYYVTRRYDAAIAQAELNLRATGDAHFNRAVLAAAYAQSHQPEEAARVVAALRRLDPTLKPQDFGTKFLNPADLEHLREGLRKAQL